MTPDQALARLKNKGRDLTRKERDALRTIAGLQCSYRVIHPTPGVMAPFPPVHSEAEADKIITSARHVLGSDLADQLIIQRRLIGEWEDIS